MANLQKQNKNMKKLLILLIYFLFVSCASQQLMNKKYPQNTRLKYDEKRGLIVNKK